MRSCLLRLCPLVGLLACSANDGLSDAGPAPAGAGATTSGATGGAATHGVGATGGASNGGSLNLPGVGGSSQGDCPSAPDADQDGDGFTVSAGDCNDCSPNTNPGAFDVPDNGVDEDCSGHADDEPAGCDQGLPLAGDEPSDAARSLGICRDSLAGSWGLVSAKWVAADGTPGMPYTAECGDLAGGNQPPTVYPHPLSRGLLPKFGDVVVPRSGASMVAISSGIAREGVNHFSPAGEHLCTTSSTPPGFPKDSPSCNVTTANDHDARNPMGLEIEVKVPTNAHGLGFDFDFYTYEWPDYICQRYNDFFVALLWSEHPDTPQDHNISFDSEGNPVSLNNALVDVCDPALGQLGLGGKVYPCSLGIAELAGTGFENHAATSWLSTRAGVIPGETIKLRFAVWDMGDENLDSTVLIDNFHWSLEPGEPGTPPVTIPSPR